MIAIINYNAGNIASVKNALERIGQQCVVTSEKNEILSADGVIFPGQGRAGAAMSIVKKTGIDTIIQEIKKPFLGICLGMQLLGSYSEEDETQCLGIFEGTSRKFPAPLKSPHLGWNKTEFIRESPLIEGISDGSYFYFVHSYHVDVSEDIIMGKTSYGFDFVSIIQKNNFFGVQFHPEKSGGIGLRLLKNFCKLCV